MFNSSMILESKQHPGKYIHAMTKKKKMSGFLFFFKKAYLLKTFWSLNNLEGLKSIYFHDAWQTQF